MEREKETENDRQTDRDTCARAAQNLRNEILILIWAQTNDKHAHFFFFKGSISTVTNSS